MDVRGLDEFRARFYKIADIEPSVRATEENVRKEVFPVRQKHLKAVLASEPNPLPIFPSYFIDEKRDFFDESLTETRIDWSRDSDSKGLPKFEIYRISRCCDIAPTPDLVLKSSQAVVWVWVGDTFVIAIQTSGTSFQILRLPICSSTLDMVDPLKSVEGKFNGAIVNVEHRLLIFGFEEGSNAFLERLDLNDPGNSKRRQLEHPIGRIVSISMNVFAIAFSRDAESWLEMWTISDSGDILMDPTASWQFKTHPIFDTFLKSKEKDKLFLDGDRLGHIVDERNTLQAHVVEPNQNTGSTLRLFGGGRIRSEAVLQPTSVADGQKIQTVEGFQVSLIEFWPVLVSHNCGVAIPREKSVHLHRPGLEGSLIDGIVQNCIRKYARRLHFFGVESVGEIAGDLQCVLIVAGDSSGAEYADWSFGTQFRLIEIPGVAVSIASVEARKFVIVNFNEDAALVLSVFGKVKKHQSSLSKLVKNVQVCARSQGKLDQLLGEILGQNWFEGRIDLRPSNGGRRDGFAQDTGKEILIRVKSLIALWLTMKRLSHLPRSAVMYFSLEVLKNSER
jgi:hypothetical protein